jgi:hypothetical protein
VSVVQQSDSLIEIRANSMPVKAGEEIPTVLAEVGTWQVESGQSSGVLLDVYGAVVPLLSANDARKLGKWLLRAAEELDGKQTQERKNKPRRHYEDEYDE